jgi:uncharacterized RDD family membrane protein YckC
MEQNDMANIEHNSPAKRKCVGCGAELTGSEPPDLCPKCLLKLAMETQPGIGPAGTAMLPGTGQGSRVLPQPGEQLGHYTIMRALGAGGMGAVYEAQDLDSGRRVALKVLSHTLDSPDARERFFREGRLAASINHPNSVYVFGTEEIGGTPVIAMELVAGGTLQDRVRSRGPLPIGEAVDCVLQIIEGLDAAQRIGILHRDIKPSNCYVGEDGTVKVGDFGLSISTTVRTEPALTAAGSFLGTPAFCSPEQLRGEELNARSDMYAVGATLYYLLTGHTPFEAKTVVALLATVFEQRAPSPRKLRPTIPQGLARAILRCLEKHPDERFKSYAELARALTPYGAAAPTPATLGLRFLAGMLDLLTLSGAGMLSVLPVFGSPMEFLNQATRFSPKAIAWGLGWFLVTGLYYAVFEGRWGAGVGKAICRLRVVGPDRNPPGFARAFLRAVLYFVPPALPYWLTYAPNPKAYMSASQLTQTLISVSCYVVMGLLFSTVRRRNGFAAVHDLLTKTRVVSRTAVASRPVLPASDSTRPSIDSSATVGPYHVLQPLAEFAGANWLLGYDLRLLRKVWIRTVPPGTEPVPVRQRNLGRPGRLRWLTGKRSAEKNWDAFEALSGRPLLELARHPQPWNEVRYWLHDLASELSAAEKEGSLPELALDRVWITADGRAKLLDFPAPSLAAAVIIEPSPESSATPPPIASGNHATIQPSNLFLEAVATTALKGASASAGKATGYVPLHAQAFLKNLTQMAGAEAVASALKPLLHRVAEVSRWRRAAIAAGCILFPVLGSAVGLLGISFMQQFSQRNPGLMELSTLLQTRASAAFFGTKQANRPTDRQTAVYIASHYRGIITNETTWSSPLVLALIKGEARKFAEQSVAEHPAPTPEESKEADEALGKQFRPGHQVFGAPLPPWLPAMVIAGALVCYGCIPVLLATLLFRGGLVLLIAGVTFVRQDGQRASRLRLLWRMLVAWSPLVLAFCLSILAVTRHLTWGPWLALALLGLLAILSLVLPQRGLQDRLAGTWPVAR